MASTTVARHSAEPDEPVTPAWPETDPDAPDDELVPFVGPCGPMPGYVAGRCGHRVAESEWRAGFRTCERCPAGPPGAAQLRTLLTAWRQDVRTSPDESTWHAEVPADWPAAQLAPAARLRSARRVPLGALLVPFALVLAADPRPLVRIASAGLLLVVLGWAAYRYGTSTTGGRSRPLPGRPPVPHRHLRPAAAPAPGWARLARLQVLEERRRLRWDRIGQVCDAFAGWATSVFFTAPLLVGLAVVCIGGVR
jgi:hypothetical protein